MEKSQLGGWKWSRKRQKRGTYFQNANNPHSPFSSSEDVNLTASWANLPQAEENYEPLECQRKRETHTLTADDVREAG